MKTSYFILLGIFLPLIAWSQDTTHTAKQALAFEGYFSNRFEYDWNSQTPQGNFRDNRFRNRLRLQLKVTQKINDHFTVEAEVRTGLPDGLTGPYITIGDNLGTFNSLPIGIGKANLTYHHKGFSIKVGKFKYPFYAKNGILWGGHILPEGIHIAKTHGEKVKMTTGASIFSMRFKGKDVKEAGYIYALQNQVAFQPFSRAKVEANAGFLLFSNMPDHPAVTEATAVRDYKIGTFSARFTHQTKKPIAVGIDLHYNVENYVNDPGVPVGQKEKLAAVMTIKYGKLSKPKDWMLQAIYARVGHMSVVPFLSQNDWGRWSYKNSSFGKLTNFNGMEWRFAYRMMEQVDMVIRYYHIHSRVKPGAFHNTGERIRLDINVRF